MDHIILLFWKKVEKLPGDGCWIWKANVVRGYGLFGWRQQGKGRTTRAHRMAWELENGPIPDRLWVLHRCDNPICVRPSHLFLGTALDNAQDCSRKGRKPSGTEHWTHKKPERVARGEYSAYRMHPERYLRGEAHALSKISDADRAAIAAEVRSGKTISELARAHGISRRQIGRIAQALNGMKGSDPLE